MNDKLNNKQPEDLDRLDAFLDGQLDDAELEAFLQQVDKDELAKVQSEQAEIDDSLKRLSSFDDASREHIEQVKSGLLNASFGKLALNQPALPSASNLRARNSLPVALLTLAASVLFVGLSIWWYAWGGDGLSSPSFEPVQLVSLYDDMIDRGFEPYYECNDDARFAEVFENRLGLPLALTNMPKGTAMLGLSYSGGISRSTTVMLCTVDEQPVAVFVDLDGADLPANVIAQAGRDNIFVHRTEKHGLVFYEVSPFDQTRVVEHMVPAEQ